MPPMRQDSHDVKQRTAQSGQPSRPGAQLTPFLNTLFTDFKTQWPSLTRCELFLNDADTISRIAGIDLPPDAPAIAAAGSAAVRALESKQPFMPDPDSESVEWAIPLTSEDRLHGVLQLELAADDAVQPACKMALLAFAPLLALVVTQFEASPPARLLANLRDLSQQIGGGLVNPAEIKAICSRLIDMFTVDHAAIIRIDPATGGRLVAQHPAWFDSNTAVSLAELFAYDTLTNYRAPVTVTLAETDENPPDPAILSRLRSAGAQSVLIVPLLAYENIIGLLTLASTSQHTFSQTEYRAIQIVSDQLATGLHNTDLFIENRQRADQLERITAFGRLVTSTFDQHEILQHVIEVVPGLLPTQQVSISLYTPGSAQIHVIALAPEAEPTESHLPAAGSGVEQVAKSQTPMLIDDLHSSNFTDHRHLAEQGLQSLLVAPMIASGRTLGTITIGHARPHSYSPTDLALLQQVGNQIAIALENERLFEQARMAAEREQQINLITARLQGLTSVEDVLTIAISTLGQALGADQGAIRLIRPDAAPPPDMEPPASPDNDPVPPGAAPIPGAGRVTGLLPSLDTKLGKQSHQQDQPS